MPDTGNTSNSTEAERQAQAAATLIDAAAGDLERNGPLSRADLRRRLLALEAEWVAAQAKAPIAVAANRRPR